MSIARKREFLAAAQALVKAREPSQAQLAAVTQHLAQMITDLTGRACELVVRFPADDAPRPLPGQLSLPIKPSKGGSL